MSCDAAVLVELQQRRLDPIARKSRTRMWSKLGNVFTVIQNVHILKKGGIMNNCKLMKINTSCHKNLFKRAILILWGVHLSLRPG